MTEGEFRKVEMHFVDEQWVNYVRNISDSQMQATIHQHLAEGCDECLEDQRIWNEIYLSTQRESDYFPDQELVRNTIGYLSILTVKRPSVLSHFAELLFDSALQPFASGIRARGLGALEYSSISQATFASICGWSAVAPTE
jgi:hypothetical protein